MTTGKRRRKAKQTGVPLREFSNPTEERLAKAQGNYTQAGDGGRIIVTICDSPLERMFHRDAITAFEYNALRKYLHHWYHAGLESGVGSVDLGRTIYSDPTSASGMPRSMAQAYNRQQWRRAREMLGQRAGILVDNVVCAEHTLEIAGMALGWGNKAQAIAAATEMLRDAGYRLAKMWGLPTQ